MGWPGRSACPEATAGPNPFRGRPSGLTRWRCGSAGGGVVVRLVSGPEGGRARKKSSARGPEKAARRSLPGGAAVRGWKSNRSQSGTCGGVPVCGPARVRARRQPPAPTPSAAARQGAHGRGPWSGFLGALPRKNRTAVAHGADPSGRSPAKIARRAWLLPSPSLSLRPERAGPLRPPLNLHTP